MSITLPLTANPMIPYFFNEEASIFDIDTTGNLFFYTFFLGLASYP